MICVKCGEFTNEKVNACPKCGNPFEVLNKRDALNDLFNKMNKASEMLDEQEVVSSEIVVTEPDTEELQEDVPVVDNTLESEKELVKALEESESKDEVKEESKEEFEEETKEESKEEEPKEEKKESIINKIIPEVHAEEKELTTEEEVKILEEHFSDESIVEKPNKEDITDVVPKKGFKQWLKNQGVVGIILDIIMLGLFVACCYMAYKTFF